MFDVIKRIYEFFVPKKKDSDNVSLLHNEDISLISIFIDTKTENIGLILDIPINEENNDNWAIQAEKLAFSLFQLCSNNAFLTKLVLDQIQIVKKQSIKHTLFFDNVLFFWNHTLSHRQIYDNEPIIRPSKTFKNFQQ